MKKLISYLKDIFIYSMCQDYTAATYGIISNPISFKALYEVVFTDINNVPCTANIEACTYEEAVNKTKDEFFGCTVNDIHFIQITEVNSIALNLS